MFIHPSSLSGLLVAFVVLEIQSIFSIVLPDIPDQQLYAKPKDGMGPSFHPATPYMAQITEEGEIQTIAEEPVEEAVEIGRCC